jgi:hypothetical protein
MPSNIINATGIGRDRQHKLAFLVVLNLRSERIICRSLAKARLALGHSELSLWGDVGGFSNGTPPLPAARRHFFLG